jgi:hypothetical protein
MCECGATRYEHAVAPAIRGVKYSEVMLAEQATNEYGDTLAHAEVELCQS